MMAKRRQFLDRIDDANDRLVMHNTKCAGIRSRIKQAGHGAHIHPGPIWDSKLVNGEPQGFGDFLHAIGKRSVAGDRDLITAAERAGHLSRPCQRD